MHPLTAYLTALREIHASGAGVNELSYYPALAALLDAAGQTLKPRVRCIMSLQDTGAGQPDGGLFTPDQLQHAHDAAPLSGALPARGAIEVKGAGADLEQVAQIAQVRGYLAQYGQVLLCNLREFALLGLDAHGQPQALERYTLAESESAFWAALAHPQALTAEHGERCLEYLQRVLRYAAPLSTPQDLAWLLASYAREARARVEARVRAEGALAGGELADVRAALEQALGIAFAGEKGEHFFRSTLVQTLFYGLFAAWVLWHKENPAPQAVFNWHDAVWHLRVPVLQTLYQRLSGPPQLGPLGLVEPMEWAAAALNRVLRDVFFARFQQEHAVQYFYEPFLQAFDPALRKELGVWYTPPEIVQYMVARVDAVLRSELGLADGLADPRVLVLDPCAGTGAYLVEVLRRIAHTLRQKGEEALLGAEVKRAALTRLYGFEILPAPFVIAHLQLGLALASLGAPLAADGRERAGVYLTNALTGWEAAPGPQQGVLWPALQAERDAAARIKREEPILVVLGNPPYNGFAGMAVTEERALSTAYRTTLQAPAPQGQGLNDLYVRFYRMAERRITEMSGQGVVCFISNYSWLDGLSFTGMRERYLRAFDGIWIDCLHGDRIISERAPDGRTSETIFATAGTSPGIKVGTAIAMLVARSNRVRTRQARLRYRDLTQARADERRAALLASAGSANLEDDYTELVPVLQLGLPFKPRGVAPDYLSWPLLPQIFPVSFPGVKTSRDDLLVDIDRERLVQRMQRYLDPTLSHEELAQLLPGAMQSTADFQAGQARSYLMQRGFLPDRVVRYCYRPFDLRWLYWEPETNLLNRKREDYFSQVFAGNVWLEARQKQTMEHFDRGYVVHALADNFGNGLSSFFPLYALPTGAQGNLFAAPVGNGPKPNASPAADEYLAHVDAVGPDLFYHTIAVLHAPAYRRENADGLRQDWPRIPLPAGQAALRASAALGRQVAALLDTETAVAGVTGGAIRAALQPVGVLTRVSGGSLNPDAGDLRLTAGWGHAGQGGVTMPGQGRLAPVLRPTPQDGLGAEAYDVYLNDVACWRAVPAVVWGYTIGGYQVLKKWLSYREFALLGRGLSVDEAREVTAMARRLAALVLLGEELDANYRRVQAATYAYGG